MNLLPFKISSALKNLIGKELITDEFVAVYELVKNSFDAYAKKVEIIFIEGSNLSKSKIIIKDFGKGMNIDDINNKWLFVAYSAKIDGTENDDYREKIKVNRVFAGAKGVGRFSCDRLGSILYLESIKDERNAKTESITVNWDKFEVDPLKEFVKVKVEHNTLKKSTYGLKHGTVLEISGLRDKWDRERILKLKSALIKLVNPNQENDSNNFKIEIIAQHEKKKDKDEKIERNIVNGVVKNDVFEQLKIKTTSLNVKITEDGEQIVSTLEDRGDVIYKLVEKNPFNTLKNIHVYLFQLNKAAKIRFHNIMGLESVKYGSVFMYKNGFRVYPFGDPGEDLLLIDNRKQQGFNRNLGSRDLIGRIEIYGDNPDLRETTSRDGGLVKNIAYQALVAFFYDYVLKRLENYAVNIIKWGDERIDKQTGKLIHPELWPKDVKLQILELITGFIKSKNVINVEYDRDFLNIIKDKQDNSVDKIIKNLSKIGHKSNNPQIVKEAAKINKAVSQIKSENIKLSTEKKATEEKLEQKEKQLSIVTSISSQDIDNVTNLHHQVIVITDTIKTELLSFSRRIDKGEIISNDDLKELLDKIIFENSKIASISKFGTRAIFEDFTEKEENNILEFLENYVEKISRYFTSRKLKITLNFDNKKPFSTKFRPLDISIIIDNMISNSRKADASLLSIDVTHINSKTIEVKFTDNGNGLHRSVKSIKEIFKKGFSTTKSTGLGLFHIENLIKEYNWKIKANSLKKGIEFILTID